MLDHFFPEYILVFNDWEGKASLSTLKHSPVPHEILQAGVTTIAATWKKCGVQRAVRAKLSPVVSHSRQVHRPKKVKERRQYPSEDSSALLYRATLILVARKRSLIKVDIVRKSENVEGGIVVIKKLSLKRLVVVTLAAVIVIFYIYFQYIQINNALRLYQKVRFSDEYSEILQLFHSDFKNNFTEEDFLNLKEAMSNGPAKEIYNYIVFEYQNGTKIWIEISPGTTQYKIVDIEIENN